MSTTLINLNLIQKDMAKSLKQVSTDKTVARDTTYYKENIGKITTVKDFIANDRIYNYAMKAYGLEDMAYAKAFMRKVLESDLSDDNSFANKLTDSRFRQFALAFNFSSSTTTAQSTAQQDDIAGLYNQSIANENDQVAEDTRYYKAMIGSVQNVDELLTNSRLRDYVLKAFDQDPDRYSFSNMRAVLTSDASDPNSYVNQLQPPSTYTQAQQDSFNAQKAVWIKMAQAFNFNADGTVKAGGAQSAAQVTSLTDQYILDVPTHMTPSGAAVQRLYYDTTIKTVTNVSQITGDSRMWGIVKTALNLGSNFLKSTFENIVTSDLNDPNSYVNKQTSQTLKDQYTAIAKQFNFDTSGNVAAGNAQTATQENQLLSGYNTHYDDTFETTTTNLLTSYKNNIGTVTKVADLLKSTTLMTVTLAAFGIKSGEFTNNQLTRVLTSDLSDPKSYANRLGDKRLIAMARDFNFDAAGKITAPKMAQSEATITETAKNYIIQKTRFLTSPELDTAKKKANTEATYYQTEVAKLKTVDDLLKNRRLIDFTLSAQGIDPKTISDDTAKKLFKSDLSDPKSYVNTQTDARLKQIVSSFNFDAKGNLLQNATVGAQDRGHLQATVDDYMQQQLETNEGEDNPGVRLALYFQRKATSVTSAYDILGDTALLEVFKTMYQLPDEFSSQKIEKQKATVEAKMKLSDLADPAKVKTMIQRFAIMYDLKNDQAETASLLSNSSGNGISANTLATLAQLRFGR